MSAQAGMPSKFWRNVPLFWRLQVGGWLGFSIFSFHSKWLTVESLPEAFTVSLFRDGLGFFMTLGMREVYRRFYRERMPLFALAVLISSVSLIGGTLLTLGSLAFHDVLDFQEGKIFDPDVVSAMFYFRTGLCFGWSLLYFAFKLIREGDRLELKLRAIEIKKKDAELQILRMQMSPHFLFNALNTVRDGVQIANPKLGDMVDSLSDYLRYSLDHGSDDLVPLGLEFQAMRDYLEVEKSRFLDGLVVECHIDESLRAVPVPGIMLQPLVENAVKYGQDTSDFPLFVSVDVSRFDAGTVRLTVRNSGQWIEPGRASNRKTSHLGLENLRRRLELIYPCRHRFDIEYGDGWVTVVIHLPILT